MGALLSGQHMWRSGKKILTRVFLLDNCETISKARKGSVFFKLRARSIQQLSSGGSAALDSHKDGAQGQVSAAPAPQSAEVLREVA